MSQFVQYTENKIWERDQRIIYNPSQFPWNSILTSNWQYIKGEFINYWDSNPWVPNFHEISKAQLNITDDDKWKMLVLYAYGEKINHTCHQFPVTTDLVSKIPGMKSAMFSILHPQKVIPEHSGNVKMILRYQLPLIVPEKWEHCFIRINNQDIHWHEGQSVLFDDTYQHEVYNQTNEIRVALLLDVLRPLPFPQNLYRNLSFYFIKKSDKIQHALQNLQSFYEE